MACQTALHQCGLYNLPSRRVVRMSIKYNVGRSYLIRLLPTVLSRSVRKKIERSLVQEDIAYVDTYNEDIQAFEVVADTYAREVSTLEEEEMPRGWSAWDHQFCVPLESTDPPELSAFENARLRSLETLLACHDLSKHIVAKGWFDVAYVSLD